MLKRQKSYGSPPTLVQHQHLPQLITRLNVLHSWRRDIWPMLSHWSLSMILERSEVMTSSTCLARRAQRSSLLASMRSLSSVPATGRVQPSAKALAIAKHDAEYVESSLHLEGQKSEIQKYREEKEEKDKKKMNEEVSTC